MTVKDFKEWIVTLPEEFNNFSMVFREISILNEDHTVFLDKPIASAGIDIENNELFILDYKSREVELKLLDDETD